MHKELFSLDGKVALVTGASRGIGRAIAVGLAEAGADVAVAARSADDLALLTEEIGELGRRSIAITTDVRDRDQIAITMDRVVDELGGLHVLVNNAGGSNFMSPLIGLRPEGWDKLRTLNLDSVFHATQLGAQKILESGGGSIVQVASVAGRIGAPGLSPYSAAKGGVIAFSQAVAKELATSNVRVNCIAPGWVATALNDFITNDEGLTKDVEAMIPMGRMGRPEEIVGAVVFLASDASSYVTGTTIVIDGGQTA